MSDEWPKSKYSIKSITNTKMVNNDSKVSSNIIQQIANNMDKPLTPNKESKVINEPNMSNNISDIGPNPKSIEINIDTEMQKLFNNGYKILRKNKEMWDELSIDDQK